MTMMEPYETATPPVVRALTIAATDAVIVPAPANGRTGLFISNVNATGTLYISYGQAASAAVHTAALAPGAQWEMPPNDNYSGPIHGLWSVTGGSACYTEVY